MTAIDLDLCYLDFWKDYQLYSFNVFDKSGKRIATLLSRHEEIFEPYTEYKLPLDEEARLSEYVDKDLKWFIAMITEMNGIMKLLQRI